MLLNTVLKDLFVIIFIDFQVNYYIFNPLLFQIYLLSFLYKHFY